jgi:8-oxo-dGTP diphosphatase
METKVIVSAIIEDGDGLLFGRKVQDRGPYPNTWHLLGGKINPGEESLLEAIKREVKEEAGVEIEILEELPFDEDFEPNKHGEMTHYIFLVYRARLVVGEAKASDDISEVRWFAKDSLPKDELSRPSIKLFKKLGYIG